MIIRGNPKAEEFIHWVEELYGAAEGAECNSILERINDSDFVPLTVLNEALHKLYPNEIEEILRQNGEMFDSD